MKKIIRRISLPVLALVLVLSMTATAFADGKVIYQDKAQEFIFTPGSEYSPTDLFSDFKGVMPGDSLTQSVEIRNEDSGKDSVRVYMRAAGPSGGSEEFLSQMNLTVETSGGDTTLFEAPADETAGLTEWVQLGTLKSGGSVVLDVTLDVPITMGNDFQQQMGALDWQFKVEVVPAPSDVRGDSTQTGDDRSMTLPLILGGAAVLALLILFFTRKKK